MNCKETTGLLFKHPCKNPATLRCAQCGKPICEQHARPMSMAGMQQPGAQPGARGYYCITCMRRLLKSDPSKRQAFSATYADDPYFYWYLTDSWDDSYDDDDYALFDAGNQSYGADSDAGGWDEGNWSGS